MRFCPLIGEAGCREDCLFRLDLPEAKEATRNLFLETWQTPQVQCGLLAVLSELVITGARNRVRQIQDGAAAFSAARRMGLDRFTRLLGEFEGAEPPSLWPEWSVQAGADRLAASAAPESPTEPEQ